MNKPITKKEWMEYLEKTWDAAQEEALAQPEQEPVACQYAKDVAMPEYRCAGKCQYAQPEQDPVVWVLPKMHPVMELRAQRGFRVR